MVQGGEGAVETPNPATHFHRFENRPLIMYNTPNADEPRTNRVIGHEDTKRIRLPVQEMMLQLSRTDRSASFLCLCAFVATQVTSA